jgi:hypothetical protein
METINFTVKLPADKVIEFQRFLDAHIKVVDFRILPDTKRMYEEDEVFQRIDKSVQVAKKVRTVYINDNINKYINK